MLVSRSSGLSTGFFVLEQTYTSTPPPPSPLTVGSGYFDLGLPHARDYLKWEFEDVIVAASKKDGRRYIQFTEFAVNHHLITLYAYNLLISPFEAQKTGEFVFLAKNGFYSDSDNLNSKPGERVIFRKHNGDKLHFMTVANPLPINLPGNILQYLYTEVKNPEIVVINHYDIFIEDASLPIVGKHDIELGESKK